MTKKTTSKKAPDARARKLAPQVSTKKASKKSAAALSATKPRRIGHLYERANVPEPSEDIPRGWIDPEGRFLRTTQHWLAIAAHLGDRDIEDPEHGERRAHQAYAQGWISVGHSGVLNAIAHETIWRTPAHPGVGTLRKLLGKLAELKLRVEKQRGKIDQKTGRHEDFDVAEYELDFFIKRGKLRLF